MLFTANRAAADAADQNAPGRDVESDAQDTHQGERIYSLRGPVRTVDGVRRDQGLTSTPMRAMLAAAADVPYTIPYGRAAQLNLTRDVARAFIVARLAGAKGATVRNLPGPGVSISEVVAAIREAELAAAIESSDEILSFPSEADGSPFASLVSDFATTPLREGVCETIERFQDLLARGLVAAPA